MDELTRAGEHEQAVYEAEVRMGLLAVPEVPEEEGDERSGGSGDANLGGGTEDVEMSAELDSAISAVRASLEEHDSPSPSPSPSPSS